MSKSSKTAIPSWLETPPSSSIQPPVETRKQELPFGELTWEDFEKLCLRLARLEANVEHCQLYGVRGQGQEGIDIYARQRLAKKYRVYQCKRVKDFGRSDIKSAVSKFLQGEWVSKTDAFVLCTQVSLVRTELADEVETQRTRLKTEGIALLLWDSQQLSINLKAHPQLVDDFFGRAWGAAFCGSGQADSSGRRPPEQEHDNSLDIDALVREVRKKVKSSIQQRCGTMRVLDMTQPIGLGDIYTDVNILEKITGRRRLEISELLQDFDPESDNFDRCGLGRISEKRVAGLKAVKRHPKLMILGKPGAGKTTFLKYLAIQCSKRKFQSNRVPIFITLRELAESSNQPNLLKFITITLVDCGVTEAQVSELLKHGKALILLDGLDEVREEDSRRVLRQIQNFSVQYHTNLFVITCRIAARDYTFENFTEVEVADFHDEQIKTFAQNWFKLKDPVKGKKFIQKLTEHQPIKELAANPLLLTLLCLEFEDSAEFPTNRSELYERGTATLLRKWDASRYIERHQIYKNLSPKRKEDLLSHVALTTFERKDYFFKQRDVERYIADYIRNLPDARTDPEALLLDSEVVLKSIEAQHGLLQERARGIFSFSHLTFQEYFTARKIVTCSEPQVLEKALQSLASHIPEKRWREVFLLAVGMLPSADRLLQLMKQQIDIFVAANKKLRQCLKWVSQKYYSVQVRYKPAAVRAFYFALEIDPAFELAIAPDLYRALNFALEIDRAPNLSLDRALTLTFDRALDRSFDVDDVLDRAVKRDLDVDDPEFTLNCALVRASDPELKQALQQLKDQLPDPHGEKERFKQWWKAKGVAWTEQLRAVMIKHLNIGYDWQFSEQEKVLLKQYHYANKLLVECLACCYVSREVRQEIEDTLLLP